MEKFLNPRSVVIVGAPRRSGEGSFNNVETMLRYGYSGRIYPVNPQAGEICGLRAYPSIAEVPERADLAVVSVGRDRVFPVLEACAAAGIGRVIVVTQGFSDADEHGRALQDRMSAFAREKGIRVLGPNTMGVVNNFASFTTSFVDLPVPEKFSPVSLVAQTGVFQVASIDFSYRNWGKGIDIGNSCDVDFVDALEYFEKDPETRVIAIHMEGIRRGRKFLEAASRITKKKPIVVLKTGRSEKGARAALSHSGSLVGEDAVYDAAFRKAGILRVRDTQELRTALRALVRFGEMAGPRIGIITVTGAGGIMAIDAAEGALTLAELPDGLSASLTEGLPDWIRVTNPVDIWPIGMIGGDYPGAVSKALRGLQGSPEVDGILMIIPAMSSPLHGNIASLVEVVKNVREGKGGGKPIALWLYADDLSVYEERYEEIENVAAFPSIEDAVRGLAFSRRYRQFADGPSVISETCSWNREKARPLIEKGRRDGVLLGEEALELLAAFGIPAAAGRVVPTREALGGLSRDLSYPVVLKVTGPSFLHKSEWGGVVTGIGDEGALLRAWDDLVSRVGEKNPDAVLEGLHLQEQLSGTELLMGMKRDPEFGPVVACGLGGIYTEIFRDVSREIAPLTREEAGDMLRSLRIYPILRGVRGQAGVDRELLVDILLRVSCLAMEIPDLMEMDINPFIAGPNRSKAADARFIWK